MSSPIEFLETKRENYTDRLIALSSSGKELQNIYDSVPEAISRKVEAVIGADDTYFDDNPYEVAYSAFDHMNRQEIQRIKNIQYSELADAICNDHLSRLTRVQAAQLNVHGTGLSQFGFG